MHKLTPVYVVVLNWNGKDIVGGCLDSLLVQSLPHKIIVVDNASTDGSVEFIKKSYPDIELIINSTNKGFAGGVNTGISHALGAQAQYIALINNDARADKDWLKNLVSALDNHPEAGIATGKLLSANGKTIDSTGDIYTTWGLPYPRGRGQPVGDQYDDNNWVFGATGGASLYRAKMLEQVGLFDEDFFAYYEDVDISFRAQLAGWKVYYEPSSIAYHQQGTTTGKIKGFATYQTFKNYPWLFWKNVPTRLLFKMWPRFAIAHLSIFVSSNAKGRGWPALKGVCVAMLLFPKKLLERHGIQKSRKVTIEYIDSILVHDLPPNSKNLRKLRSLFIGK